MFIKEKSWNSQYIQTYYPGNYHILFTWCIGEHGSRVQFSAHHVCVSEFAVHVETLQNDLYNDLYTHKVKSHIMEKVKTNQVKNLRPHT